MQKKVAADKKERPKFRLPIELSDEIARIADEGRHDGITQTGVVEDAVREYLQNIKSKNHSQKHENGRKIENVSKRDMARGVGPSRKELHSLVDAVLDTGTSDQVQGITHYLLSMGAILEKVPQEVSIYIERAQKQYNEQQQRQDNADRETHARLTGRLKTRRSDAESSAGDAGGIGRRTG